MVSEMGDTVSSLNEENLDNVAVSTFQRVRKQRRIDDRIVMDLCVNLMCILLLNLLNCIWSMNPHDFA